MEDWHCQLLNLPSHKDDRTGASSRSRYEAQRSRVPGLRTAEMRLQMPKGGREAHVREHSWLQRTPRTTALDEQRLRSFTATSLSAVVRSRESPERRSRTSRRVLSNASRSSSVSPGLHRGTATRMIDKLIAEKPPKPRGEITCTTTRSQARKETRTTLIVTLFATPTQLSPVSEPRGVSVTRQKLRSQERLLRLKPRHCTGESCNRSSK